MYMPDLKLALGTLDCPPFGRLLLFDTYDPVYYQKNNPCDDVVRKLAEEGMHRNVFLVDEHDVPRWRIGDYSVPETLSDSFLGLKSSEDPTKAIGTTFQGNIFEIDLRNGALKKIGWTKT